MGRLPSLPRGRNFVLLLDTATTAFTNMLLVVFAARTLNAVELAHFSLAQLVTVTVVQLLRAGLYSPAMSAQRITGPARIPLTWPMSVGIPVTLLISAATAPFIRLSGDSLGEWFLVLAACMGCSVAQDGLRTVLVSSGHEKPALFSDLLVLMMLPTGILLLHTHSAIALLLVWAAAGVGGVLLAASVAVRLRKRQTLPVQSLRATWALAKWATMDMLMSSLASLLPFFVATAAQASTSAGVYRTLQTALGPLNIVHTTVVTVYGLDAWKTATLEGMYSLRERVRKLTLLLTVGGLAYALVAQIAMIWVSGIHASDMIRMITLMTVSATLGAANSGYNAAALAMGRQKSGAILRAIIVTASILISLPASATSWVPWHDPVGVSIVFAAVVTFVGWAISYTNGYKSEITRLQSARTSAYVPSRAQVDDDTHR